MPTTDKRIWAEIPSPGVARDCSTSADGIFACGDVTTAFGKRIIIAPTEGANVALRAKQCLTERKEIIRQ